MNSSLELLRTLACLLFWLVALPLACLIGLSIAISDKVVTLNPKPRWVVL